MDNMKIVVDDKRTNLISISASKDEIIVSSDFENLDELEKEFLITQVVFLKQCNGNYLDSDSKVFEKMREKYPDKKMSFWYLMFLKFVEGVPSELNLKRLKAIQNALTKN